MDDVVCLGPADRCVASWEHTSAVAHSQGAALGGGGQPDRPAHLQDLVGRVGDEGVDDRVAQQPPQVGVSQPGRTGEHVTALAQHPPEPVPGQLPHRRASIQPGRLGKVSGSGTIAGDRLVGRRSAGIVRNQTTERTSATAGALIGTHGVGKTTLLKQIAKAVTRNHPEMKLIILLIDERPEEVTDIKESIEGKNVEVIYSTFDELPENHKRVSEMVIERAKRLVEHKQDVIILLDSITRLARAYNLTVQPSGRTLSGGLDPAALHMPKRFFGAARNMREGGSLTILATALVDTGSRMDDVVFEEFKGTGNMELSLDRSLSEKRIFPAIDLPRSSTRREDLLLSQSEMEATYLMRKALGGLKSEEALERIIDMFLRTKSNAEFIEMIKKTKMLT